MIEWIGLRPAKKKELQSVKEAQIDSKIGLVGDHFKSIRKKRQITLIQKEHLDFVSATMKKTKDEISFLTRRNIVVSNLNLLALKGKQFKLGEEVILEYTDPCHPCSRMEENLGDGGLNAMRGHGGICAKVIKGGTIKLGDKIIAVIV
jgi:MOSC domain-containing protein YiiM